MKTIEELINSVKTSDLENMSPEKRKKYFEICEAYCKCLSEGIDPKKLIFQNLVGISQQKYQTIINEKGKVIQLQKDDKHYEIIISGLENIPDDGCIISTNHTCKDDAFTITGVLHAKGVNYSILGARDGIKPFAAFLLERANALLFDRTSSIESRNALYQFDARVLAGYACIILPEGTWNFHPVEKMLNMWPGVIKSAAITGKPIIPMIMEYIEVPHIVTSEKELYSKCVVRIGKPFYVSKEDKPDEKLEELRNIMIQMREEIQEEYYGKVVRKLSEVDKDIYVNHASARASGSLAPYDNDKEVKRIYVKRGEVAVNMYHIGTDGELEPGTITPKGKILIPSRRG